METADRERCFDFSDDHWWNKLPEDFQEEALAWLPVDFLSRYRSTCMEWNVLLSSKRLLNDVWAEAPLNRKPQLLLCQQGSTQRYHAYCFYTGTWKVTLSLSFLERYNKPVYLGGSAEGRLMVFMGDLLSCFICNPYRQTSIKLPPPPTIEIQSGSTILGCEADMYKVMVMGRRNASDVKIVDIYDSSVKSWSIAGYIPEDLDTLNTIFLDDYFYCFTWERRHIRIPRIVVFNIQDTEEMRMWVEPLPELVVNPGRQTYALIRCGSRLLMVSIDVEPNGLVIIWEFHKDSSNPSWRWNEITRMPASLRERLVIAANIKGGAEGVGDYVCFISVPGTSPVEVLVYHLNERSWNWLPTCPLSIQVDHAIYGTAFQPTPDVNIR